MLYILSTFDECGAIEYRALVQSVREQAKGFAVRVVALCGDVEQDTRKELAAVTDRIVCFKDTKTYRYFDSTYGKRLFHPLGKLCKLFFARDYVAKHASPKDLVLFLDTDVLVQRSLSEFVKLTRKGKVLFAHELQMIHHAHRDNARLRVAERFDKPGPWMNTYITEVNTGVNLSFAADFLKLIGDFEDFVKVSDYFKVMDKLSNGAKWHDQDFFRYFYRKTQRQDIGVMDIETVYTTTFGAARCLYFDCDAGLYVTAWDAIPFIIHFAGSTMSRIPRLSPEENLRPAPKPIPSAEAAAQGERLDAPTQVEWTGHPRVIAEPELRNFPLDRHAIYLRQNTRHFVERWMRRVPRDAKILLLSSSACADDAGKLERQFPQIVHCMTLPAATETGTPPKALAARIASSPGFDSVMIPMPVEQVEVQFLPGNYAPKIDEHYGLFRALWRSGFRRFALNSFAGTKYIEVPWLLDGFVNCHKGERCFLAGNGPSLNEIDMSLLKGEITFGSNRCYMGYGKWGFDFTYWGVMDRLQVEEYGTEYELNVPGHTPKFFPFEYATMFEMENMCPVPFSYEAGPPYRFSGTPDMLYLGFTVTHMLMQIAVIMGCNPIYLIGCDHRYHLKKESKQGRTAGTRGAKIWTAQDAVNPTHFTAQYTAGEDQKKFITPKPDRMDAALEVAREWCDAHGVQVLNATPNTGLKIFPLVDYNSLFQRQAPKPAPASASSPNPVAFPKWTTYPRDEGSEVQRRIEAAERGEALCENDGRIAALKDIHRGKIGWLLGNGPSVRMEDLERLRGEVAFGCNRLYLVYDKMVFRPTYLCSTDEQMIRDFGQEMADRHPGKVLLIANEMPKLEGEFVWFRMGSRTPLEFSSNVYDYVMPGGGTLISALQIGRHMGITRFYIYGMDHSFTYKEDKNAGHYSKAMGDNNHFIKNYRSGKPWAPPVLWQVEGALLSAHVFLQRHGGWVRNATRGGKLEVLDRVDFDLVAPPVRQTDAMRGVAEISGT